MRSSGAAEPEATGAFSTAFPVVKVGYQLALVAGPPLVAIARDLFDGYRPTFAVLALADIGAVALLAWNGRLVPGAAGCDRHPEG